MHSTWEEVGQVWEEKRRGMCVPPAGVRQRDYHKEICFE